MNSFKKRAKFKYDCAVIRKNAEDNRRNSYVVRTCCDAPDVLGTPGGKVAASS